MVEIAFYPAVALIYFFGVMGAAKEDRVKLDDRASINVFCLFVLAQPLCLVLGGYTGMATYLLTALISYNFLPWRPTEEPTKGKESKKKKWEHSQQMGDMGEESLRKDDFNLSVSINVLLSWLRFIFWCVSVCVHVFFCFSFVEISSYCFRHKLIICCSCQTS